MAESYLNAKKLASDQHVIEYVPLTQEEHYQLMKQLEEANSRAEMWKSNYMKILKK